MAVCEVNAVCQACGAQPGQPCVTYSRPEGMLVERTTPHPSRQEASDAMTTTYPPRVTEALTTIAAHGVDDGWVEPDQVADLAGVYEYVTFQSYLPGHYKPGAAEFEPQGDALSHAYLVVLAYETTTYPDEAHPDERERWGEFDQDACWAAEPVVQARTGHKFCPTTGMGHRIGGSVATPICLDCEVL